MATLILTAVGTAVGGPIGGAIGAMIGQSADRALFGPKARHGPRLGDLAVQTSSYGTDIPKIYGTMRVAGTVIWATDIVESRSSSGGGKGKPKTVNYSYSANFAVAISARPIRTVRRIWADGKLLRGASGDFKSSTGYRLHTGSEDQDADPLIVSAEGATAAPAFRGIAYAVFEGFQLEDYGNHIPSLTFEVEADQGAVDLGDIANDLGSGAISADNVYILQGYAAGGDSIRSAIEGLAGFAPLSLSDDGFHLRLSMGMDVALTLPADDESGRRELIRRAAGSVPAGVSVAYYDVDRDYQTGLQRAVHAPGRDNADQIAVPVALSASGAKALAEQRLAMLWAGRTKIKNELGWRYCHWKPGARVRIEGETGLWKIERWSLRPMAVNLELIRIPEISSSGSPSANSGRPASQPDLIHGPTRLRLFDLPLAVESGLGRPMLFAFAAGEEAGWRRADLTLSYDQGQSWQASGPTAGPAVMGAAINALGASGSALFDEKSSLEVELLNDSMWLESRSDAALAGGANLAIAGGELIQFAKAEPIGGRRFRLSRFLRGRRGTEWAASLHSPGEDFILIAPENMTAIEAPPGMMTGEARLMAAGLGDEAPETATVPVSGRSLQPPSPVHLRAARMDNGDIAINWVRRSRQGWAWNSGMDTPLSEESEQYRISLSGSGFSRDETLALPSYLYTASQQAADGASGPIDIAVVQIGTYATSIAANSQIT